MWGQVSRLNGHHMGLAWTTLASLVVTDAYIALVAAGTISDLRFVDEDRLPVTTRREPLT